MRRQSADSSDCPDYSLGKGWGHQDSNNDKFKRAPPKKPDEETEPTIAEEDDEVSIVQLNLPFGGTKGETIMKKLSRKIERINKNKVKLRVTYTHQTN